MIVTTPLAEAGWNDQQRALFQAQMSAWQKDEVVGVLLALFLGTFGAHHFYLRRKGLGILYLVLFWTGIPAILGIIEAFFMPGRVRRFNAEQASLLAYSVVQGVTMPPPPPPMVGCPACGMVQRAGGSFCVQCGRGMV